MKQPPDTPPIPPDDAALFRAAVRAITPLAGQNRIPPPPPSPHPVRHIDEPNIEPIGDTLSDFIPEAIPDDYLANGVSRMTLRKLRRGNWPVNGNIDLHGYHIDEARVLLQTFLHTAGQQAHRCVLIVHGKGINSEGGTAVLRQLTRHWLTQLPVVLAYCNAPAQLGGSGAVLVLLRHPL